MSRAWLALILLAGACSKDESNAPAIAPSVSAVQPSTVYLGRTLDVHLSGFDTMWTDATTLSFGDGITVNKVTAGSPTGLTANITIAASAAQGARDFTVMDGTNTELFKSSFTVSPPVKFTFQGTAAQGSLSVVHVDLLDHDNLFDTTNTPGFLGPPTFTNLDIKGPTGVFFSISSVTPTTADATLIIDVDAAPATLDLDVLSGPPMGGTIVHNQVPASLTIAARTAVPLVAGPNMGTPASAFDSQLYKLTPGAGGNVVQLALTGGGASSSPSYALLPKSGHFADLIGGLGTSSTLVTTAAADVYYLIFWDAAGDSGYQYNLARTDNAVTVVAEAANNDVSGMAQALTLPALVQNADFSSAADVDFYSMAIATTGKKLHVTTFAGDSGAAQSMNVFGPNNANTSIVTSGPIDVGGYLDFLTNTITVAGTYFLKDTIAAADPVFGPFDPTTSKHNIWLRLQ